MVIIPHITVNNIIYRIHELAAFTRRAKVEYRKAPFPAVASQPQESSPSSTSILYLNFNSPLTPLHLPQPPAFT